MSNLNLNVSYFKLSIYSGHCDPNVGVEHISGDFKLIKNTGSFELALRVYDVDNLLAFIPIQQSVGMPFYYADSVQISPPVSCGSGDATVAPDCSKYSSGTISPRYRRTRHLKRTVCLRTKVYSLSWIFKFIVVVWWYYGILYKN